MMMIMIIMITLIITFVIMIVLLPMTIIILLIIKETAADRLAGLGFSTEKIAGIHRTLQVAVTAYTWYTLSSLVCKHIVRRV